MSLIVLNSRGQDPAEFENHGFNIKLGRDCEFCLCGVNLNRPPKTPLQLTITNGTNNGWMVGNGHRTENERQFHSVIPFKLREGVYDIPGLESELSYSMNGNYEPEHIDNYAGMMISCWRATTANPLSGGLEFTSNGGAGAEQFTISCAMTKIVNGMKTRLKMVVGAAGGGKYPNPDPASTTYGQIPSGIPTPGQIIENATNNDYIQVAPSPSCKNFICLDPLWNTSNDGRLGTFAGIGPIPADGTNDGWTWGSLFEAATDPRDYVGTIVGGVICSKWTGGVAAGGCGLNGTTNVLGPQAMQSRWAEAGNRYDIYWVVGERSSVAAGFQIVFYYTDITAGPEVKNNPAVDTRWGEFQIAAADQAGFWEICMRPISNVAWAPDVYRIEAWGRRRAAAGGVTNLAAVPATAAGAPGYYVLDDGYGPRSLYENLPIYQGLSYNDYEPATGRWNFRSIHHNARPADGFGATVALEPFNSSAAAVNNPCPISVCFSPVAPNFQRNPTGGGPPAANPLRYDMIKRAPRRAGIAQAIGFQTGTIQEMPQGTTATTGVEGSITSRSWEASEPVAVIQLPNIPLHGELGSGSTIWGGSNGGRVLGVAMIDDKGSYANYNLGMNVYTEASLENWISCGNLGVDALNQIKVKITDQHGRKLVGLYPDSTIWLKVRSKTHGNMRTGGNDHRGQENPRNW